MEVLVKSSLRHGFLRLTKTSNIIADARVMVNHSPPIMLRFLIIRAGIVAVACMKTCTRTNPMKNRPKRVKRAMMRPSLHL